MIVMKKISLIVLIPALIFLSGCMMSAAEEQAYYAKQDHSKCIGYGFKQGSTDYSKCRMLLDQGREEGKRASSQSLGKTGACLLKEGGYSDTPTTLGTAIANCQ
jgi:hypothetical protein